MQAFTWMIFLAALFPGEKKVETSNIETLETTDHRWRKDQDKSWKGTVDGTTYWYKLDEKGKLNSSTDGKNWELRGNGMWADKAGRMMMITEKRLVRTLDEGKTWTHVPDWAWQGSDGKWYKFDKDWVLWVADH